ncbi:MAG: FIST C-terminal domain-containing protein [Treponema sp.]|jgi:hypothetical protein|nr:FIST C-terminal domain-containing protein [Treponema sp.]
MIKILTAYTYELDNPEKAVQDILNQIDIKNGLLKNSAALLFCHAQFIEMGVTEAVCKSLPFDVVGCTCMYLALPSQAGEMMLTVTVLTSDDTEFAAGICEPLTIKNTETCINALYQKTAASLGGTPALAFAFPPTMLNLTIDVMAAALDRASGGLPVFGTVALDMHVHIRNPRTIYKGAAYSDRMALLLLKGPVNPRFFSLRFPEKSSLAHDAVITDADGARLISINNRPAASFLKEVGLIHDDKNSYTHAIPLVVEDSGGANPEVVVVQDIDSNGTLICSRHIPVGGILNIGAIIEEHILESAQTLIQEIKKNQGGAGLFIFSCFLRTVVLGGGAAVEVELIQRELSGYPGSYLYLNSGGELCPRYIKSGKTANQALQYAIIACQL